MELTLDQRTNLKTWAEQRDTLLKEIAILSTEKEVLTKGNKNLVSSNTDLENKINAHTARLEVLDLKEKEKELLISQNIARLMERQTELQSILPGLQIEVNALVNRKGDLISMIGVLEEVHEKIFEKVGVLGKVVDHVKRVGSENTEQANYLLASVRDQLDGFSRSVKIFNETLNDKTTGLNESIDRTVKLHTKISEDHIRRLTNQGSTLG